MTLKPASRAVVVFALMVALAVPAVAWASSYWSTLAFWSELRGATRYYNGNNMRISLTSRSQGTGSYTVRLYRDKIIDDYIGYASLPKNGSATRSWSNTGPGYYYFYFINSGSSYWIYSDNVHMYNY